MKSKFECICKEYADSKGFSGACMVKTENEALFAGAYGYANRAFKVPESIDTKFDCNVWAMHREMRMVILEQ